MVIESNVTVKLSRQKRRFSEYSTDINHYANCETWQGEITNDEFPDNDPTNVGAKQKEPDIAGCRRPVKENTSNFNQTNENSMVCHSQLLKQQVDLRVRKKLDEP
ncbi:hypothetical protein SAMN05444359_113127 [Neolewinella agarilytica]|uniref:Uncharacterized protein n=1 Tax=Neolewinella agarilytica TaxID=478744 RepID=A0A1H9HVQ2_9BACT|nr:hypothetical protein SAMN05444359_113127 [Neolewinella agarilytica]